MRRRVEAAAYPLRFRTSRGWAIHAGRVIAWDGAAIIEAACRGVTPPHVGEEDRRSATSNVTCRACARRIASASAPQGAGRE